MTQERKPRLGRGLDALFGAGEEGAATATHDAIEGSYRRGVILQAIQACDLNNHQFGDADAQFATHGLAVGWHPREGR